LLSCRTNRCRRRPRSWFLNVHRRSARSPLLGCGVRIKPERSKAIMSQLEKVSYTPGAFGLLRVHRLRRIAVLLVAVAALGSGVAHIPPASGQPDENPAPIFVDEIPDGYRDWKLISVAHEEGDLKSLGAILGNDVAIRAYREGKLPYPDG